MGLKAEARAAKVAARANALNALQRTGELAAAVKAARELWDEGRKPSVVRIRRGYYWHSEPRKVVSERKPLPRAERPLAAQMIDSRGVALKLHLVMLFAAHCQAAERSRWRTRISVEPQEVEPVSWMGLMAAHAVSNEGAGVQVRSSIENKARQIVSGLKKLRDLDLILLPRAGGPRPYSRIELMRESGGSTAAAPIPYTVPTAGGVIELPVEFFTHGWVYLLSPSEIMSYLMWLDVNQHPRFGEPFITAAERAGQFGLGREAYETHKQLDAFCLISVDRPTGRYSDGKFDFDYGTDAGSALCHRVTVDPQGLSRDAVAIVGDVLRRVSAVGDWDRPLDKRR